MKSQTIEKAVIEFRAVLLTSFLLSFLLKYVQLDSRTTVGTPTKILNHYKELLRENTVILTLKANMWEGNGCSNPICHETPLNGGGT